MTQDSILKGQIAFDTKFNFQLPEAKTGFDQIFPLSKKHLGEESWNWCVYRFFASKPKNFESSSAEGEFYLFMIAQSQSEILADLLNMEWAIAELTNLSDAYARFDLEGDVKKSLLVLNPEVQLLRFRYPVFALTADNITHNLRGEYYLCLYRHPISDKIHLLELTQNLARLVSFMADSFSNFPVLKAIAYQGLKNTPDNDPKFKRLLQQWYDKRLILGFINP